MSMVRLSINCRTWCLGGAIAAAAVLLPTAPALAHPGHGAVMQLLSTQTLTPGLSLTGLAVAFLAGSSHALTPGHGKTVAAAYLVGSRGTPRHALLLGLVTTITHTLGVFALGLLTLFASRYMLPEQLYPILSFVSGITVCGVGFWLLDKRLHSSSHTHDYSHIHTHAAHSHAHVAHIHTHAAHSHTHQLPTDAIAVPSLVALGIAGGLVPCPSALVLLLSAVALHQVAYGLLLVSAFSVGLAFVLIAIGLLVIYAQRWLNPSIKLVHNWLPFGETLWGSLPIVSAIVVIFAGAILSACAIA